MECRIQPIQKYPFDLKKEESMLTLSYTCFVGEVSAQLLEIQGHGFRYLETKGKQEIFVLIIKDTAIVDLEKSITLFVPYNILRIKKSTQQTFKISRRPIQLISLVTPKMPEAKEINVYFNTNFKVDFAIVSLISQSTFVFKNGEYYLDSCWLEKYLKDFNSQKAKLQWQYFLSEAKKGKYKTYMRIYIEAASDQDQMMSYFLFKKGTTKLTIKQKDLHPYNVYRTISLEGLEESIFELEPYSNLLKNIKEYSSKSSILLLQAEKDSGTVECLHHFSQTRLGFNFYLINCFQVFSTLQFYRQFSFLKNLQSSLILIRNIEWIEELYQSEQILNYNVKLILKKMEDLFRTIVEETYRTYVVVVEYQGKIVSSDMLQNTHTMQLILDKPTKAYVFKQIFNTFDSQHSHRDQIIQLYHDKFGWEVFKDFMKRHWKRIADFDFNGIVKEIKKLVKQEQAENLIEVSWDDVGGLELAKEEIVQTILLPIRHPQIFDEWIKPRTGLLFYGPPGTGKTLLGKCIAKQCKMNFISVKGPELLNMYVGESQKNVRQIFERAIACKPCIIFMDELDALVPKRGNGSDSNQVMDRIVAELLMQMDTASANQVFIIGATNRPDLLDPSIMRPGRFDKQIYLGITTNKEDRIKILKAQTRNLCLQENMNWDRLLENIPKNFTGADFFGLTSKAVMEAAERTISQFENGLKRQKIILTEEDFLSAVKNVKPSVTEVDLQRYEELKKVYS